LFGLFENMNQRIKDLFNEEILMEAMQRYGIKKDDIKILDSFESFIYEFEKKTGEYILRIGHSIRRNVDLIHGKVDWINFLADQGVGVSKAITSNNGNLVEAVDDLQGGQFLATAFVKAKGASHWGKWTPALFESYGELLGKMHFHTQYFQPLFSHRKRHEWDDPIFDYVEKYLPDSDWKIRS
jgi:Ser/Thr protein kinase RdoA (MazF antagonist)